MTLCSEDKVRQLEALYRVKLPTAYVGFLRGDYGDLSKAVENLGCDVANLEQLRSDAVDLLTENSLPFTLGPQDFVFAMHEEGQFFFFHCDPEQEDPPVYAYVEGDTGPRRVYDSFSAWVHASETEARFLPGADKGPEPEVTGGRIDSTSQRAQPTSTANPGEEQQQITRPPVLEIADLLTPALRAELQTAGTLLQLLPPATYQDLGRVLAVFRPSVANAVAAIVFGVLFIAVGGTFLGFSSWEILKARFQLPLITGRGMSWVLCGMAVAFALGLIFAGAVMVSKAKRLLGSRLLMAEEGFCWARRVKPELLLWKDVAEVQEVVLRESLPIKTPLKHALPKSHSQQYVLRTRTGRQLSFSANNVQDIAALRPMLERVCSSRQIPWSALKSEI